MWTKNFNFSMVILRIKHILFYTVYASIIKYRITRTIGKDY